MRLQQFAHLSLLAGWAVGAQGGRCGEVTTLTHSISTHLREQLEKRVRGIVSVEPPRMSGSIY